MMRKVVAFVLAYACFASSVWSLALPGVRLGTNGSPIGNPLLHVASAGAKDLHPLSGSLQRSSAPQTLASVAAMNGSIATAQVSGGGTTTTFFGPQQYARTTGDPNTYTTTVQVPAWVVNPFNLHVQNGEADGSFRVSSATISVNNLQVAGPSDFNQNVFTLDRSVTLTPTTTLAITLASKPGSYLRINLAGVNGDHTPPAVTIAAPATAINTPQAHFDIQYKDLPGTGEPAASGVNTTTLQVLIDGVDRTSLFTVRSDEATADLPASLALGQGPHQVTASIQDNAGNTGQATVQFQVDTTPPTLQIVQPVAGSYLKTATPQIQLAYSDNFALNLSSLKVTVNGTDYTSLFTKTATGATATLPALPQRANQMIATISDQAGNPVTASIVFNVDTTPPVISIVHPATGSTHGSATVEYLIQYSDDQLIDLTSLTVTVDGNPVPATAAPSSASGSVTLADNANHVLSASIKDKAGNLATTSSTFSVDTTAPNVHIVQPVPGAILNASTPQIQVQYDDNENVNLSSFRFTIDGTDVTALFSVGPTSASANLQSPLAEGTHALSAQIADSTGNIGQASSQIFIDTIRPQLSIVSPSGAVNTAAPSALAQYSDSGSGIDPKSVHVTLDGIDVTSTFSVASDSTTGILGAGGALSESTHQFAVTVADKAGNVAQASSSFLVDVTPPSVTFLSPANNSFTNNTQPSLVLNYQDSGSGVDPTSIHVFLQQGNAAETEITSLFALGPVQATATIPAGSPLAAATYHLRAVVGDRAGNQGSANSAFAVDTTAPVCTIQAPAANQFLNTATPALTVSCQDDSSGIDPTKFVVQLDGVDVTSQMSATSTGISGTFSAVADGTHQIQVQASDRAGNPAPALTEGFLVDTTPPTISIISPANASQSASNPPAIAVTFADGGSGIDVTTFTLLIDGADHTAEFTTTAAGATGTPVVALAGGAHVITATVKDLAGNTNSATTTFSVTTAPLQISITQPASGTYTNANSITISGNVSGGVAPVTVTVEGGNAPVQGSTFSATTALGAGPTQVIHVSATDGAGGSSSATVTVNIDRVNPTIIGSIVPAPNAAGWNNSNVTVNFACSDDNSGVATCSGPVPVTTEGANQIVTGTATDKAGNTAQTSVTVKIDKTPPLVTATAAPPANAAGWNNSNVTVTFTCSDSLSGVASCPASPTVVASEGQNQLISGQATDVAGNVATASVSLSIDKTAPTIVQLSTPSQISPLHGGQVSVTASDNFTVTQVVISVNGSPLGTFTSAPYQANLTVPAGANPGDTLTVTAVATDQAGNTQTASRGVIVAADGGVIVGQVLDDGTSFPVQNASVQVISATGLLDQTDDHGRYSLQVADSHLFVTFTAPAAAKPTTNVEREVFVQLGVGTVPVDARLTTLGDPVTISSSGGTLSSGTVSVSVPAGAAVAGSAFRLTYLSGQGLPGLLPLGWSPLAAFDLRSTSSASGLSASVTSLPNVVAHLVTYDFSLHAWTMLAQNLQPVNGAFSFTLPGTGAFALVTPDTLDPPLPLPDVGSPLSGVPVQMLSPSATSSGSLNPATLPPSGGTALATLGVQSPTPLLSGTVIQANISETFSLASGDVVSEETRSEDIVLYNALAPATSSSGAVFPVSPSHHYSNAQLLTGKVHLDILAGREGVRGQPGGNDPVTVSDGTATLSVPGGALSQDTAISVVSTSLEDFVPTSSTLSALQEILVDFSGEMLSTPAQLSISAAGLNPAHTFLLTQVQRITGVPHIVAVAVAQVNGSNLTSVASPGLPGVIRGGEYIFYDVAAPAGFIQGVAASSAGPVPVLVGTDSLQIVNITGADGRYIVPALAGTVNLRANGTTSSVTGTASTQLTAGQTATVNIQLNGTVNTATISPADQSLGVSVSTIITVTSPVPLDPKSIVQNNLLLVKGTSSAPGAPVALQPFILSTSGTTLTFAPVQNLDAAAQYTAQVTGLADMGGGAIVVPTSTFTTKANQPLTFDPNAITFGFPDQNGNIHVSAPAGSLSSGTKVLIVDQTNAVVLSITAFNDGSLSGDFPGTINDVLQVTVTDPNGATASFTRSQFVAPDGSVAVGPGGGTVTGPGGLSMVIPEGALTQGAVFSLKPLGADAFPQLPNFPGATFGGGMQINTPSMPAFKKEVKLSFSKPADAPDGGLAFYYVYRQLTDQNGNVYFETIDHAFAQGTGSSAQVVTASPPFCGYVNSYGNFNAVASASFVPSVAASNNIFLVWERVQNALNPSADPNQPGIGSQGLIVGRALQTVPPGPGQTEPTFTPLAGATVWIGSGDSPGQNVAITSDACGTFTIFDPQLGGGLRTISAISPNGGPTMHATAEEVNGVQTDDQTYLITEGLENTYRNIGRVTLTFSPVAPPPPPSQVDIRMFTLNSQNLRIPSGGIVQVGVPLVIAVKSGLSVTSGNVAGVQLSAQSPDHLDNIQDTQPTLDARLYDPSSTNQTYTPTTAGSYTLTVTGVSPLGGPPIQVAKSFLVVNSGGDNTQVTPGQAPTIVSTVPAQNAKRVATTVFPGVTFSEPVTTIPGNIALTDANGNSPPFILQGVRVDGSVANPITSSDVVTSVTVQPSTGLKFGTQYTLSVFADVQDRNQPPLRLGTLYTLIFTTVGPQELDSSTDKYASTRPVLIGRRAYIGKVENAGLSALDVVNIDDPTAPLDVGMTNFFTGRVVDIAGQASSPIRRCSTEVAPGGVCGSQTTGGPLVALAATVGASDVSIPSNIWLYDVSSPDQPVRVGAVSATTSATQDGSLLRIFMKDNFIFTSTFLKGLQVIDIQRAIDEFQQTPANQFGGAITVEGNGFALDAVVNTIPVPLPLQGGTGNVLTFQATMMDVKAGDYATGSPDVNNPSAPVPTQTLIAATGRLPFVVADPQQGGIDAVLYPPKDNSGIALSQQPLIDITGQFKLLQGAALVLGGIPVSHFVGGTTIQPIAVVVGSGSNGSTSTPLLAAIDMTDPKHPAAQGFVPLVDNNNQPVTPVDVILKDTVAVVGTEQQKILLVDITDPTRPFVAGEIDGLFGDRLALTDDGILVTTSENSAIGGVHTAAFGSRCAAFRKTLRDSSLPSNPPQITADAHLSWTVSGGFSQPMENNQPGALLNQDGLVLTDVKLGRRTLAQTMSLPYFTVVRDTGSVLRCNLMTNSDNACTGAAPGVNVRSHLLKYNAGFSPDGTNYSYQAQYLIDYLDGNPDTNPDAPDSCVLLTQQYEFYAEGLKPLEPFGKFPSALFRPLVSYTYFTEPGGPKLQLLTAAQRLHFDAQTPPDASPRPSQPPFTASLKSPANGSMLACDPDPVFALTSCTPDIVSFGDLGASIIGTIGGNNPMVTEQYLTAIDHGNPNIFRDLGRNDIFTILDNIHFWPTPANDPDQPMDEPGLTHFGCPACVHMHLRWSSVFNGPGFDPAFGTDNGKERIPVGSNQNVDIAVLRAGGAEEQHPAGSVSDLFVNQSNQPLIGPNIDPVSLNLVQTTPVFWYVASGHQNSDQFFFHGAGFGTFYMNRITVPPPGGGPLTLNIEHSRDLQYEVDVSRMEVIPTADPRNPLINFLHSSVQGTLAAGVDDILGSPDMSWGPNTTDITVTVTLIDNSIPLNTPTARNLWTRDYHFARTDPSTLEP